MFSCNLVLSLSTPDAELPDLDKSFFGDDAWKELDKYLGQNEGYSAERYRNQAGTVVSKKDGTTYTLWVGLS